MHQTGKTKTYALDIETVSQGKRAKDYVDKKRFTAPSNYKNADSIAKNIQEQKDAANKKHGLSWITGKVVSVALCDVFGDDEDIVIYGIDEVEILMKLAPYMEGQKLIGKTSFMFDFPFLVGRYMANGLTVPHSLKLKGSLYDVDTFFGWSAASSQRGSLDGYAHGIGYKSKPMHGSAVQGLYDTILMAMAEDDQAAVAAGWKELSDYNLHDTLATKQLALAYYGKEGMAWS